MKIPIAADAWRFVIPLLIGSGILLSLNRWWSIPWGVLGLLATIFCLFFFRDFDRKTIIDENLIYSPADGKILEVSEIKAGPHSGSTLIRIFLSVFDVHVQRMPISGTIQNVNYRKGLFLDARDPEAHMRNEQNEVILAGEHGTLVVTQIAGLIARRILCWVKPGEHFAQGQRYGLIRFGSQVDVVVPRGTAIQVHVNDRVVGGETVLAEWAR